MARWPDAAHFAVVDDGRDFYGRQYWDEYPSERNLPGIGARARTDLSDRCLFWLANMLEYVAPPGRVLEIGCGHGGFVRLLNEVGFDAVGTELSPWVVEFARRVFDVRVYCEALESLTLEPGFAAICSFDVLEHVADPLAFLRRAGRLLDTDGVLFLQTPWYRGEGPDWSMFQPDEHVFLFSEKAARLLLDRAGFQDVVMRPSLFPYDMWIVASRATLPAGREQPIGDGIPVAIRALLDLRIERTQTTEALARSEADRAARLAQVEELTGLVHEAEADRAARLEQIQELIRRLGESELDRGARIEQITELTKQLREAEADRAARLEQVQELTQQLGESEADRAARLEQVQELTQQFGESEADRAARLEQVQDLTRQLGRWEADRAAQLERLNELELRLAGTEATCEMLRRELERTRQALSDSENEKAVRLADVEDLTRRVRKGEEEVYTLQHELETIKQTWLWRAQSRLRPSRAWGRGSE